MAKMSAEDAKAKLLEIDKTIKKLDPAIRAAAFDTLAPYYFDGGAAPEERKSSKTTSTKPQKRTANTGNMEEFIGQNDHNKPKDNVFLIAAWLYSQHGKFAITRADVDEIADEAGLTVPDRADATMRQAKHNGKNLFRKKNKGWELTVSGEARLKDAYGVKKGNQPRPSEED